MPRKNNTVVSAIAHMKMNEGDQLFLVDYDGIQRIVLLGRPYWKSNVIIGGGNWWYDYRVFATEDKRTGSCGDEGVPGFAYDNRPCRLVKTHEEAKTTLAAITKWWVDHFAPRLSSVLQDDDYSYY